MTKTGDASVVADRGMVLVPKQLLAEVLCTAEFNSVSVAGDRNCSEADHAASQLDQDKINQLREIAGIPTD